MVDIFLSYSQHDRTRLGVFVDLLEQEGFSVWWDPTITPGERFADAIGKALDSAGCVIVAWSKSSIHSHWVQDEAGVGRDRGVLVPITIDDSGPPLGFRQFQTANLGNWNGQKDDPRVKQLISGIRRVLQVDNGFIHDPQTSKAPPSPANNVLTSRANKTKVLVRAGKRSAPWVVGLAVLAFGSIGALNYATIFMLPSCASKRSSETLTSIFKSKNVEVKSVTDQKTVTDTYQEKTCTAHVSAPNEEANIDYKIFWDGWSAKVMITKVNS